MVARSKNEKSKVEQFFKLVDLTTISYLERSSIHEFQVTLNKSDSESKQIPKLEISDCREMAFKHLQGSKQGSFYLEILAYETICKLYKLFYKSSQITHNARNIFKSLKDELQTTLYSSSSSVTAAQLSFVPENDGVRIIPDLGCWMIQGFVTIKRKTQIGYQPLYTHPMEKSELIKALNSLKEDRRINHCNDTNITIWSHSTFFAPETVFNYRNIDKFPRRALILPAIGGVSLKLDCTTSENETELYSNYYTCVPKQYDVGNLTCTSISGKHTEDSNPRPKRNIRSLSHAINKYLNFTHFKRIIKENSPNTIAIALKNTRKLLPNIMSCGASVAGCDYCMYFLTTYNLTVSPAACVGGCSLGTFASCSSLVGTSFVNTYLN